MGYRITYGEDSCKRDGNFRYLRILGMTAAFFLAFVLMVGSFWPGGREVLRDFLLPGDGATAAFRGLAEDLRSGEPVGEAVTAFCREIIENAELPE